VLAPNAKLRREIVPSPPEQATAPACDHAQGAPARLSWARLLKRVFDIDIEHCPNCGGSLKIIAAIEDPPVIVRILTHLGLPTNQFALASIPISGQDNCQYTCIAHSHNRRIELYGASIDSGAVSQLADSLEAHM
jgi:hypothetical protein